MCTIPVRVARQDKKASILAEERLGHPKPESQGPRGIHTFLLRFVFERSSFGAGRGRALRGNFQVNKCAGLINVGAGAFVVQINTKLYCAVQSNTA